MSEVLELILPVVEKLIPYLTTLVVAVVSLLIYRINAKIKDEKIKTLSDQLEQARSNATYIKCPKCGERVPLSEIVFYLPGEVKDNNLNGIPDDLE